MKILATILGAIVGQGKRIKKHRDSHGFLSDIGMSIDFALTSRHVIVIVMSNICTGNAAFFSYPCRRKSMRACPFLPFLVRSPCIVGSLVSAMLTYAVGAVFFPGTPCGTGTTGQAASFGGFYALVTFGPYTGFVGAILGGWMVFTWSRAAQENKTSSDDEPQEN